MIKAAMIKAVLKASATRLRSLTRVAAVSGVSIDI